MERNIFKYFDGTSDRFGDPIALHRALVLALRPQGGDISEVCKMANSHENNDAGKMVRVRPDLQAAEYQGYILAAAREAFSLGNFNPMTGEGVMDETVYQVLDAFFEWEDKKKANTDPLPTCAPPSETPGLSATTSSSASG